MTNNPLRIEFRKENDWKGAIRPHDGGRFDRFQTIPFCIRAGRLILQSYSKQGVKTVADIIARWAPPSENNTASYISYVSDKSGFKPDTVLDLYNDNVAFALLKAMAKFESNFNLTKNTFYESVI